MWLAALLVLAVSADGVAVGAAYGLRGIRIPWSSLAIVGLASNLAALLAVGGGRFLTAWLSPRGAARLGAVILLILGVWYLLRPQTGVAADLDRSGRLDWPEAAILGLSLALDAVAAGVGLALTGQGMLFAALVGPVQALAVSLGRVLAHRMGPRRGTGVIDHLPGGILVVIGLLRLMR